MTVSDGVDDGLRAVVERNTENEWNTAAGRRSEHSTARWRTATDGNQDGDG